MSFLVVAGVATGVATLVGEGEAFGLALALASVAALACPRRRLVAASVAAAALAAAVGWGASARNQALAPPLLAWLEAARLEPGEVVVLDGILLEDAALAEGGVRLRMAVEHVTRGRAGHSTRGRALVHVGGAAAAGRRAEWTAGRRMRLPALARAPALLRNPGGPHPRWQVLRRDFDVVATVKSAALVESAGASVWFRWSAAARAHVRRLADDRIAPRSQTAAAVFLAIAIGDRAGLPEPDVDRLRRAGTYHVIAISGGNVAIVVAAALLFARLVARAPRARTAVALAGLAAYGAIVSADPSVRRAVTAAGLYLALDLVAVRPRPVRLIAATAATLAIVDPLITIDVGAWLSFAATLAIVLAAPAVLRALGGRFVAGNGGARALGGHGRATAAIGRGANATLRAAVLVFAATVAAELALLPITTTVFGQAGVAGFVLNFVAIPAMALVQLGGGLLVLVAPVSDRAATGAAAIVVAASNALLGSARLVDIIPGLSWRVPPVPVVWVGIHYGGLALLLAEGLSARQRRAGLLAAAAGLVALAAAPDALRVPMIAPGRLRVVMLDVGQGDSIFLETPSGHRLLVDTGGGPGRTDIADRVIVPAAWALGARRLTALVLTHGDLDHAGGALGTVPVLRPREIWEGVPVPGLADLRSIKAASTATGVAWRRLQAGDLVELGEVALEVLHPPRPDWERRRVRNDDSVVLRVTYRDVDWLLTGDAGAEFERAWLPADARPIRLLKVGHHGSRTSTSADLVSRLRPAIAFISVGRGNLFGHPAPDVLARLDAAGVRVFRTDRDGAISVVTDGHEVTVTTSHGLVWRQGVWRRPS